MGTYIQLMINKTCIDYGKNNYFKKHYWLFPLNSKKEIEYAYADNFIENKEGFSTDLASVKFRLNNLDYSLTETKNKYETQLRKWNRVNNLNLPFDYFFKIVNQIDLKIISDTFLLDFIEDYSGFRGYINCLIENDSEFKELNGLKPDEYNYALEDFLKEILDIYILLRILCENDNNLEFNLEWQYIDIIESGWASLEDIEEFDKIEFIINHNKLYGKLQLYAIEEDSKYYYEKEFDNWLVDKGLKKNKNYTKLLKNGTKQKHNVTLPVYIRNVIHHPENVNNTFSDHELNDSITYMLEIIRSIFH